MDNRANIKAVITADDRASATLGRFGHNVDTVGRKIVTTMKVAAAAAAVAVGAGIVKNVDNAIRRLDTLNNSARTFENMGFAARDVGSAMKALDQSIRGLPTPLDDAVRGMTLIASATNDIKKSQKIYTSLNNAVLGFGGTAEQASNAVIQLSQDLAGGRITAQTWLSMLNSGLGPALAAMARQMGITTRELRDGLSEGTISVEKFQDSLIEMNEKGGGGMKSFEQIARDSTKGIQSSWANMNTAIARGIASLLDAIGRNNIAGFINGIGVAFENFFKTLIKIGPIVSTYVTPGLTRFIETLQKIATVLINVLGPPISALISSLQDRLLPQIISLWNAIEPGFTTVLKILAQVIGIILVGAIWAAINVLNIIISVFGAVVRTIRNVITWFGNLSGTIINIFRGLPGTVSNALRDIGNIIVRPFKWAFDQIKRGIREVEDAFNRVKGAVTGAPKAIGGGAKSLFKALTPFAEGGFTGQGASNDIAGVVHKGEYVLPPSMVDQSRGLPKIGGQTVNVSVNVGVYAGSEVEKRKLAAELYRALQDVASSKSMTVAQMLGG